MNPKPLLDADFNEAEFQQKIIAIQHRLNALAKRQSILRHQMVPLLDRFSQIHDEFQKEAELYPSPSPERATNRGWRLFGGIRIGLKGASSRGPTRSQTHQGKP